MYYICIVFLNCHIRFSPWQNKLIHLVLMIQRAHQSINYSINGLCSMAVKKHDLG